MKKDVQPSIVRLLEIMAALRAPTGCPWDREQDHQSIRYHAIEEVYELLDAIETRFGAHIRANVHHWQIHTRCRTNQKTE